MKKIIILLTMACVWWHNAAAQSEGGVEQYYYMYDKTVTITPVVWYQSDKGLYLEGRYNYEAENTLSVYAGKAFEKKSTVSYTVSPMIGCLVGEYKGLSLAVNGDIEYKKIFASVQSQYTFSLKSRKDNFLYSWWDLGYQASDHLSAGVSVQRTNLYQTAAITEKGVFMKLEFGRWSFPFYFFLPAKEKNFTVMGLNLKLQQQQETVHSRRPF